MKLDTRSKILPAERAGEFQDAVFVAMYLDPLTAAHARRLDELAGGGRKVVVVLSDPPEPLVPLAARAELAAALDAVSAVIVSDSAPPDAVDERPADLERRETLVRHVLDRHAATSAV